MKSGARDSEPIPIIAAARHVRLQASHVEALFGRGRALARIGSLALPHVFACAEELRVRGPAGAIDHVRVVGPAVKQTVVKLCARDLARLGLPLDPLPRTLETSLGCTLEGPAGTVVLAVGLLTPRRTLSIDPARAAAHGLKDGDVVTLALRGDRGRDVVDVRVQLVPDAYHLSVDVDDSLASDTWSHVAHMQVPALH